MHYDEMQALLQTRLKKSRYEHSVRTSKMATTLAARFGVPVQKAQIAGLLHDCARAVPTDHLLETALHYQLPISKIDECQPILLHADLGAIFAHEIYEIDDPEICTSIKYHTVAHETMTKLEKIIYLSDLIEPGRDFSGVEKLRDLAANATLDETLLAALDQSICFIIGKQQMLHPQTVLARNSILYASFHHE